MDFESFFNPESVAVVGASHHKGKVGHAILTKLIGAGYKGRILPVNSNAESIEGLRCCRGLETIRRVPDLVIIVVPARIVPAAMTAQEARQMLVNTKTYKMPEGVRGEEPVDIDAVAEGLQRLSQLVTEFPQIEEMDINPYVVGPQGTAPIAVDARISVQNA